MARTAHAALACLLIVGLAACSGEPSARELAQEACEGFGDSSSTPAYQGSTGRVWASDLLSSIDNEALPAWKEYADLAAQAAARDDRYRTLSLTASELLADTDAMRAPLRHLATNDVEMWQPERWQEYQALGEDVLNGIGAMRAECRIVRAE